MKILIIGASGQVGTAARRALQPDNEVIGAGRSTSPAVDIRDPESIERLFADVGEVDAVVVAVGSVPFRPLAELARDDYLAGFFGKVLSQLDVVRLGTPHVRDRGSFTLTSGVLARAAVATGAAAAMANGALESFAITAAREMPRGVRLNVVSPGVLEDAPGYHDAFPGFVPVTSRAVGAAYRRSVHGVETGATFAVD